MPAPGIDDPMAIVVENSETEKQLSGRPEGVPLDAVDISGDGGLCKRILVAGDPSEGTPFKGAEVQVHYVGTLVSDGSKFDSSRDRAGNFKFKIGKGNVIKGWDVGVATMLRGEKAELYCRSDYAYGAEGSPPKIPGGATLKFEVELLSWAEPEKQKWEYTAREKIDKATDIKTVATTAFKAEEWWAAREKYDEAAEWVDRDSIARSKGREDGDKPAAQELHVACLLNAAQCSLKLSDWPMASTVCTRVLGLKELPTPSRIKALFRRGTARLKMADFDGARADLKEACTLDPKSKEIREVYGSIKEAEAAAKQSEKGLFAKMVKGAGGIKKKPPQGVPSDAVDISDDGGLCKRILVAGDPSEGTPPKGAQVQVHYVGTLLSNGSKFDSSRDRPGNFSFKLGMGRVIKGWDVGVATMLKGEKAELYCRSDYAYGDKGSGPKIPGGATLKFEVELLSWADGADMPDDDDDDADDMSGAETNEDDEPMADEAKDGAKDGAQGEAVPIEDDEPMADEAKGGAKDGAKDGAQGEAEPIE